MSRIWDAISAAMGSWHQGKLFIERGVAVDHDTLHVIVGVVAWLGFALIVRRPVTAWRPWLWLLALIGWNETADLWIDKWPDPGMQYGEGAKDLLLTMLLPTLLLFAARARPDLFRQTPGRKRR
ncbi:MAG: hypothetical protein ABIS38_03575 [Sphingomicrobium sp.]